MEQITGDQPARGRSAVIAFVHEIQWANLLLRPSWERELGFQHFLRKVLHSLSYNFKPATRLYRHMHIGAAQRGLSRSGDIILVPGYALVSRVLWLHGFSSKLLPTGANIWYNARMTSGGWTRLPITFRRTLLRGAPVSWGSPIILNIYDFGLIKIDFRPAH